MEAISLIQYLLGKAVFRDAVPQHTAQMRSRLEDINRVPLQGEVIRRRKAGGSAADDGYLVPGSRLGLGGVGMVLGDIIVGAEALQGVYGNGALQEVAAALLLGAGSS